MIRRVPKELIADLWPVVGPMLKTGLNFHPFLSIEDLYQLFHVERADLIIEMEEAIEGAIALEIIQYPSTRVANVISYGGKRGFVGKRMKSLIDYCVNWAQERQCQHIGFLGRPGWLPSIAATGGHSLKLVQAWRDI